MSGEPHLVVIGLMGAGKSTTAARLSHALARPWRDSDADVEALFGCDGAAIAARHGVEELHRLEAAVLLGALASSDATVIAAAASVVEDARCREAMERRATVVVLHAGIPVLLERMTTGAHRRTMDRDELESLAAGRAAWFDAVADLTVDTEASIGAIVGQILSNPLVSGLDGQERTPPAI